MLKIQLITDASVEPVTVAEVKNHLRVTDNTEDAIVSGLITGARKYVEQILRRSLISQTFAYYLDDFPNREFIQLPFPPLLWVDFVKYYDQTGVLTTMPTDDYQVDNKATPGRITLKDDATYPTVELDKVNAVQIQYQAGYGNTADDVPMPIRLVIIQLVSHWFENREPFSTQQMYTIPKTLDVILAPYRFMRV